MNQSPLRRAYHILQVFCEHCTTDPAGSNPIQCEPDEQSCDLQKDLAAFEREIEIVEAKIGRGEKLELANALTVLRVRAINIADIFSNLADDIEEVIVQSRRTGDDGSVTGGCD